MDVVSRAAADSGARNIGVLPEFMKGLESPYLTDVEWTPTMSARKEGMRRGVSVAIALPGGIGTLDELFETMVLVKLGRLACKVIAFDVDGFWKPLEVLMDHLVEKGMLSPQDRQILHVTDSIDALKGLLK